MNIPGFIDLQVNGYLGADFSGFGLTEELFAEACRALVAHGTVAMLPTIVSAPVELYRRNLPLVTGVMARPEFAGRLLGIHLEGPFLSAQPGAVGAHNPAWVRPPDVGLLNQFQEWAAGRIRMITIAADQPGGETLVRHAVRMGITVALGHHMATEDDLARMAAAGARALTHLGNGAPQILPRHANPIWAGLASDDLVATIITDGHHLPPSVLKVTIRAKGVERVAVISDASPIAGMPPGRYTVIGNEVILEPSGRLYSPTKGCLVGSSATMLECMNYLASLDLLSLDDLEQVGFYNPLKILGVDPGIVPTDRRVEYEASRRRFFLI